MAVVDYNSFSEAARHLFLTQPTVSAHVASLEKELDTTVAGIKGMIATGEGTTEWNSVMAAMLLTLIPPVVIVLVMQRAFVRGLVDSEK